MKIFHIVSNKEWGGGEQYVYDLSQRQMADGIDVTIFCKPVETIIQKYAEAGMKVVPLALGGALDVKSAWQMAKVIHATAGPCAIHAHNFKDAFTACYARCLSSQKQVRVVMCRHLTRKGKNGLLYRWLYRHLDRLIFDSDLSKTVFLSTHPTIDAAKLGVIHTSIVVPEGFTTVDIRTKHHLPAEDVIGMFHGRLDPEKGLDVLLEAVALLRDKPFRLVLVGRGSEDYTAHLKQVVQEKGIAEKVVLRGLYIPCCRMWRLQISVFWSLRSRRGVRCHLRNTCHRAIRWLSPTTVVSVSMWYMSRMVCWCLLAMSRPLPRRWGVLWRIQPCVSAWDSRQRLTSMII